MMILSLSFLRQSCILIVLSFICGLLPLVASRSNGLLSSPISAAPSQHWEAASSTMDGDDGSWSTFAVQIGSPSQDIRIQVSTSTSVLSLPQWVVANESADFFDDYGLYFDPSASTTWQRKDVFESPIYEGILRAHSENVQFGSDHATLGRRSLGEVILKHEAVASFASSFASIGSLGLAPWVVNITDPAKSQAGIIHDLADRNNIPSASYGYTAGASYKSKPVFGSLTLGGYDNTRFSANHLTVDFCASQDLLLGIESITTSNESLLAAPILAMIDSSVASIWLPEAACREFERVFNLTWNEELNLYPVNETLHQALQARNASTTFTLSTGVSNANSTIDVVLPYASFDLAASYPRVANATSPYFPLRRAQNGTQYTLGRVFLQEAYLLVDYDRYSFSVSQALFPGPGVAGSIVPIYRPYSTIAWSGILDHNISIPLRICSALGRIVFWLTIFLLCMLCVVSALKANGIFPQLLGKRFDLYLPNSVLPVPRKNLYRMLAESGNSNDSSPVLDRNSSYGTQQSFQQQLQVLEASLSQLVYDRLLPDTGLLGISAVLAELEGVTPSLISISTEDRSHTANQLKNKIEELTQEDWNWWPLRPSEKPLRPGYSRVYWLCVCGEKRSQDVPSAVASRLCEIVSLQRSTLQISHGASNMRSTSQQDRVDGIRTTASGSHQVPRPFTTDLEASTPAALKRVNSITASSAKVIQEIERKDKFVFLGITKHNAICIAQINVKGYCDDAFFERLQIEYNNCRGLVQRLFGIWQYSYCNFVKFEKFAEKEFAVLCSEIPDPTNEDYDYTSVTHNPPISPAEFRSRFYNCRKRRTRLKAPIMHYTHQCRVRCQSSQDAIARIPKKIFALEQEGHGREYFWGIHAVESVSFFVVMVYHILLLVPPFVFWFLWLFAWDHEGDLQNASIPFMATVTVLAIVWGVWIITNMPKNAQEY